MSRPVVTTGSRAVRGAVGLALGVVLAACGNGDTVHSVLTAPRDDVSHGPQLALAAPTSIVVAFRTGRPRVGRIELGPDPAVPDTVVEEREASRRHVFELGGLSPQTEYYYRVVVDGEEVGGARPLRTPSDDPAAPVTFAVWGDSGAASEEQRRIAEQVAGEDPDLVLITGDVVYVDGAEEEIQPRYFEPYRALVDRIPFYPCLGNHDVRTAAGQPLLDALYLPRNGVDGSERFYSFECGAVHFVALDSNQSLAAGSPQLAWLEDDLRDATAAWKIVYLHHPPYSSSTHGSDLALQDSLGPVLDAHGVDLVLSGHDHDYERTHPIRDRTPRPAVDAPDLRDPDGTVFVVTGAGGRSLYPNGASPFTARSASVFHHCIVRVEGATLELQAIAIDDTLLDRFSITKSALEP